MTQYEELLKIIENEKVEYGLNLPKELNKKLALGMTRWVARYGTLSDGHEKITPAQRYFQSIKEIYYVSQAIKEYRSQAMFAQADILDAEEELEVSTKKSDKLRAEAKLLQARSKLTNCFVMVQDNMRILDEFDKVRRELEVEVETKYPEGIEQAERDNWIAVAEYRMIKSQVPGMQPERLDNVPLDPLTKAKFGVHANRLDAVAPLMITQKELLKTLPDNGDNNLSSFVNSVEEQNLAVEHKELI